MLRQARHAKSETGFTLIELILVMTILTIAVSLTAPALANFFRGRTLDSEARKLLSLTRLGQSRAVSEGIPMQLWLDAVDGKYGLEAEPSYEETDPKAVEISLDSGLQLELGLGNAAASAGTTGNSQNASFHSRFPQIRFLPDGSVSESSPQNVHLSGRDGGSLWLVQSRTRSSYEIRNSSN